MKSILFLLIGVSTIVHAQKSPFQIGGEVAVPNGNLKNIADTGFGCTLRLEAPLSNHLGFIMTLDYISFAKKEFSTPPPAVSKFSFKTAMIPIQVGGKFYLFSESKAHLGMYVSGEIGVQIMTGTVKINGIDASPPNETDFSYAPGVGYRLARWDLSYRQQFATSQGSSVNYTGFRLAYLFRKN